MPKFTIIVTETILAIYAPASIEAADREAAEAQAELMRCNGELGEPQEAVTEVEFLGPSAADPTGLAGWASPANHKGH